MAGVFVTGARGFIGSHLARELAQAGYAVAGLGHGLWPEPSARATGVWPWINGDITAANLHLLQRQAFTPDAVFHLAGGSSVGAAVANPLEDFHRTVTSSVELLEWARQDAPLARIIAVSSAAVYGDGHDGPIPENAVQRPYSPYGHHKRMMEELCISYADTYGLAAQTARLFSVYGTGLRKQLLWDVCTRLAGGVTTLRLGGSGDELRDWTEVRDVARVLRHLYESKTAPGTAINVGTGVGVPVRDIACRLARHWAQPDVPVALQFSGEKRLGDPFSLIADPAELVASGFRWSVDLDRGIDDYVAWFRRQTEPAT